jgi:NitT/TauT family transport system permease protein
MARVVDLDAERLPTGLTRIRPLHHVDGPREVDHPSASRPGDELAGLDALETAAARRPTWGRRLWAGAWPLGTALGLVLAAWQAVAWSGVRPSYLLPGPGPVLAQLRSDVGTAALWEAVATTLQRALKGYACALAIGGLAGVAASRSRVLRAALGSILTGLQTMPSIAWLPAAILWFGLSETAVFAVVVLGAAPSIASGVLTGIAHVPPSLLRAGRVLGARGLGAYRHVILPAALPGFANGLAQAWAFSWRSLMAAELIAVGLGRHSLGVDLQIARDNLDVEGLYATMIVIVAIGILVDVLVFARLEAFVRQRWGMSEPSP